MTTIVHLHKPRPWYQRLLCLLGVRRYCQVEQGYRMTSTSSSCWEDGRGPRPEDWEPVCQEKRCLTPFFF